MNSNERYTYTQMRAMSIKRKLNMINPEIKDLDNIDVVNIALAVFSYICDAHVDEELEHGELVHDLIDDTQHFIYNVNTLIYETREQNNVLNDYIDKHVELTKKEVKK